MKIRNKPITKQQPIIAIIGAGIAGLHCAYQLQKKGIIAQVYEADNRIGGRIYTKYKVFGENTYTEFGAEFIDSNHEDMLNLAKEFDLQLIDTQADIDNNKLLKDTYFFNNRQYSEKEVIAEFSKIIKKLVADKELCGEDMDTEKATEIDNISLEKYVRSLPCATWFKDMLCAAYVGEFGLDASEQSALNFLSMIETNLSEGFKIFGESDERYKIEGGNSKIIEKLGEKLTSQIKTSHKLVSIKTDKTDKNKTIIKFENNIELLVDILVLAIPFTILRNIEMEIEAMTEDKKKCIKELGYGQNNKIILGFQDRIWRKAKPASAGYLFDADIHNGFDSTHGQNNNEGIGTYTVYIGGKPSIQLAEASKIQNLKEEAPKELAEKYLSKLEKVFKGAEKSYNGRQKAALWSNNPYSKASYSCYKIGQWTTIAGKESEAVGNIHFAGEHCSSDFQGYMNGGAETGRTVAETIIKKMNKNKQGFKSKIFEKGGFYKYQNSGVVQDATKVDKPQYQVKVKPKANYQQLLSLNQPIQNNKEYFDKQAEITKQQELARLKAGQIKLSDGTWIIKEESERRRNLPKSTGEITPDYSDPLTMGITVLAAPSQGLLKTATTKLSPKLNTVGKVIRESVDMLDPTSIGMGLKDLKNYKIQPIKGQLNSSVLGIPPLEIVKKNTDFKPVIKDYNSNTEMFTDFLKQGKEQSVNIDRNNKLYSQIKDELKGAREYYKDTDLTDEQIADALYLSTKSEQAQKGLKDSKVQDLLHHGSLNKNIEVFKTNGNGLLGNGLYLSNNKNVAESYANPFKDGSGQNYPLLLSSKKIFNEDSYEKALDRLLKYKPEIATDIDSFMSILNKKQDKIDKIGVASGKYADNSTQYLVKNPQQVKSLFREHLGKWDWDNPNIHKALIPAAIGTGLGIKASTNDNKSLRIGGKFKKGGLFKFIK